MRAVTSASPEHVALSDRAMENLRFIRSTMEQAGRFTAMPGWGLVLIGLTALVAASVAGRLEGSSSWLFAWLGEAGVATLIGLGAAEIKARKSGQSLRSGPARKMLLSLLPTFLVGAMLTYFLVGLGAVAALPGVWLLLYGAGMMAAGTYSVPSVPVMGLSFLVMGGLALLAPAGSPNFWMALGFGGLHIGFGLFIARRYGG